MIFNHRLRPLAPWLAACALLSPVAGQAQPAAVAPAAILAARGVSGFDVYGWLGSLATYGFIVTYALVSFALPRFLRNHGVAGPIPRLLPAAACIAMLLALVGNLYPIPEGPYGKLPYIYIAYLAVGMLWFFISRRRRPQDAQE